MKINSVNGSNGTAGSPTYSFENDTSTGLFRYNPSTIGISTNGTYRLTINTTDMLLNGIHLNMFNGGRIKVDYGTTSSPGIQFASDSLTGISGASGVVNIVTANFIRGIFDSSGLSVRAYSVPTLSIIDADSTGADQTGRVSYKNSAATETAYVGFEDAVTTDFTLKNTLGDLYVTASNGGLLLTASNGNLILSSANNIVASAKIFSNYSGTASLPNYSFNTDQTMGMYNSASGVLGFTTGGTQRMTISSSGISVNSLKITSLGTPTANSDAATKLYVDNAIAGLSWKSPVKVATTANITLSGTQTIDGVAVVAADRVLVKNQSTASQNGIYVVGAGAWTRATDFDETSPIDEVNSAAVFVMQGTINADYGFTQTAAVTTVGTDAMIFVQFNGAANLTAGVGLVLTGNVLDVNLGAGIAQLPSDEVGIDLYAAESLILTTDGTTSSTSTGAKLHLLLDGTTLQQSSAGLKIRTAGVTETQLASSVAGNGLSGGNGTALAVNVDDSSIEINSDTLRVKASGITNTMLANSTVTVAGDTGSDGVALGETLTFTGGTGIDTSVAANVVTVTLNANIDDLADVSGCTAAAKGTVLASTGAGAMIPRKIMHKYVGSAATSHVITHNLNQKHCVVTVIETATDEMIIPQTVLFDTANQLTVSFNASLACTVVIMGLDV